MRDLVDLPRAVMEAVFDRARKELTYYPQVPELRHLAGVQPQQLEHTEADQMWVWLTGEYLPKFGVDGRKRNVYVHSQADRMSCKLCGTTGFCITTETDDFGRKTEKAKPCSCRETESIPAPQIPLRLRYTLQQLGVTVRDALIRILDCQPEYQGVIRKDFREAYERAVEAEWRLPAGGSTMRACGTEYRGRRQAVDRRSSGFKGPR